MEIKLNYEDAKKIVETIGKDAFLKLFQAIYKHFDLYTMSLDWINSSKYILKFKGMNGDLVVDWK